MILNKKGSLEGTLYIVGGLGILLFVAFLFIVGSSVLNFVGDTIVPEFDALGMVGDANMTQISGFTLHPVNTMVQSMTWFSAVLFIFGILAIFGLAFAFRNSAERWLVPLFFCLMFLLVLVCIFMSNIYEDFLATSDSITSIMAEHSAASYFIIYSPVIMTIIGFIAGIIMFGGSGREETA